MKNFVTWKIWGKRNASKNHVVCAKCHLGGLTSVVGCTTKSSTSNGSHTLSVSALTVWSRSKIRFTSSPIWRPSLIALKPFLLITKIQLLGDKSLKRSYFEIVLTLLGQTACFYLLSHFLNAPDLSTLTTTSMLLGGAGSRLIFTRLFE